MAGYSKNQMEYSEKESKVVGAAAFNRSLTMTGDGDIVKKSLYLSPAFQRNGSIKNFYGSSFGSMVSAGISFKGKVKKLCSIFESPRQSPASPNSQSTQLPSPKPTKLLSLPDSGLISKPGPNQEMDAPFRLPGTEDRVVIYFTSLRGIRRTFQDCYSIRMIFRGFRVNLDERDISMDVAFKKELQKVLGEKSLSLPQVFIKGKYIGGAEVVKQLHEAGELARLLKGLPLRSLKPCEGCDDVRFIPCSNCSGSRKVFDEDDEQLRRCPDCNENGLVRCPLCYS